ncbi:MAG: hypothetical protein VYD64_06715 [Pseudomonadota bacterium]|nr:hypothetical protein [Pseudomonadota bacterium]
MKNLSVIPAIAIGLMMAVSPAQAGAFKTGATKAPHAHATRNADGPVLATSVMNGWNVVQVNYGDGTFFQNGGQWIERNPRGTYHFTETHRDEWSVYLHDAGRNARIQLDLWQKKIYYSDPNTARMPIYTITGASWGGAVIQF